MMQIEYTSPLTHNISGTAKVMGAAVATVTSQPNNPHTPLSPIPPQACAQTILALYLRQESRNATWWMSNFLVLGGSMGYAMVKQAEMKRQMEALPVALTPVALAGDGSSKSISKA
jgi:GDP-fucose transporter C1